MSSVAVTSVAMGDSSQPFGRALHALMAQLDLSYRKLAEATGRYRGEPFSHGYLQQLVSGERAPSPEAMQVIASAVGVAPTYFAEYREHLAAEAAKEIEAEVGLDAVLAALEALRPATRRPRKR